MQWKRRMSGDSINRKGTWNMRLRKKTMLQLLLLLLLLLPLNSTLLLGGEGIDLEFQESQEQPNKTLLSINQLVSFSHRFISIYIYLCCDVLLAVRHVLFLILLFATFKFD
jgi:hypothetical protein